MPAAPAWIASRLTGPQREALLWLPESGDWRAQEPRNRVLGSLGHLVERKLADGIFARLAQHSGPKVVNGRWAPTEWRATPLGLRVRAVVAGGVG